MAVKTVWQREQLLMNVSADPPKGIFLQAVTQNYKDGVERKAELQFRLQKAPWWWIRVRDAFLETTAGRTWQDLEPKSLMGRFENMKTNYKTATKLRRQARSDVTTSKALETSPSLEFDWFNKHYGTDLGIHQPPAQVASLLLGGVAEKSAQKTTSDKNSTKPRQRSGSESESSSSSSGGSVSGSIGSGSHSGARNDGHGENGEDHGENGEDYGGEGYGGEDYGGDAIGGDAIEGDDGFMSAMTAPVNDEVDVAEAQMAQVVAAADRRKTSKRPRQDMPPEAAPAVSARGSAKSRSAVDNELSDSLSAFAEQQAEQQTKQNEQHAAEAKQHAAEAKTREKLQTDLLTKQTDLLTTLTTAIALGQAQALAMQGTLATLMQALVDKK